MSFTKHGIAAQSVDLGKTVLALSALGLFTKLLNIDLGKLQILGVELKPSSASLIPGFLGLALLYAFACFIVARMEGAIESEVDKDAIEHRAKIKEKRGLLILSFLISPISLVVYSMPFAFGLLTISLLWSDSMKVLRSIW
ncbi:hypothetical protein [Duganella qianjiadongensis]|uniref:hypothetical protein n=1 Tax=Duganella qianjiadongensis TaxID=2692176 RepID=UPI001E4123EE|nr:hypothetical protein [Duganella qianjiadongensis]